LPPVRLASRGIEGAIPLLLEGNDGVTRA
jgi:hypothetical protein